MSTLPPIQSRVRDALKALLRAELPARLLAAGHDFLTDQCFEPMPPGVVTGDHVAVSYMGTVRPTGEEQNPTRGPRLRLTRDTRDNVLGYVIEIFCFGASDDEAQQRAEAVEGAIVALLDDEAHRYLGGLLSNPLIVGSTDVISGEDEKAQSLVWHSALPVACLVRTTRPEQTHV